MDEQTEEAYEVKRRQAQPDSPIVCWGGNAPPISLRQSGNPKTARQRQDSPNCDEMMP